MMLRELLKKIFVSHLQLIKYSMNLKSKLNLALFLVVILSLEISCQTEESSSMGKKRYNLLTNEEKKVILHKGTEYPFTGEYNNHYARALMSANNVILRYITRMTNLNLIVGGQALTMK